MNKKQSLRVGTLSLLVVAAATVGCSEGYEGEQLAEVDTESALIRQYLATQGTDPASVRVDGDRVWVEEDAYHEKAPLLEEIAAAGFQLEPGQSAQGYYHLVSSMKGSIGTPLPPRASPAYFKFDASVPAAWRASFRAAASAWSVVSADDCVALIEGNRPNIDVSQITISMGEAGTADGGGPAGGSASLPRIPHAKASHYVTGSRVTIDYSVRDTTDAAYRDHLALHELGHSLGFKHPWKGAHIKGTAVNQESDCCEGSYASVMDYTGRSLLSVDDRLSLTTVFKKQTKPSKLVPILTCTY